MDPGTYMERAIIQYSLHVKSQNEKPHTYFPDVATNGAERLLRKYIEQILFTLCLMEAHVNTVNPSILLGQLGRRLFLSIRMIYMHHASCSRIAD